MKTAIVYYSRTGATAMLADALAKRLHAEAGAIHCPRYRAGALRYLLAGYDSVKGRLPEIQSPVLDLAACDVVLIGTPIWTSHPSLPARAFLASRPMLPMRTALFLTYGGHSPPETAIEELAALLPHPPVASLALKHEDILNGAFAASVGAFVRTLKQKLLPGDGDG